MEIWKIQIIAFIDGASALDLFCSIYEWSMCILNPFLQARHVYRQIGKTESSHREGVSRRNR
jgi:hypothetical protein